MQQSVQHSPYIRVASVSELNRKGRLLIKAAGRQIAIFQIPGAEDHIYACNNRCPHEGYPLIEGSINGACELTCNWHNWKFDLASGQTLIGGDRLRRYPVCVAGDDLLLDLSDPPLAERSRQILDNLTEAMPEHEYDRMAREIARLIKIGGDPLDAVRRAIQYSHDRFEFGYGHAYAASADWLGIHLEYRAQQGRAWDCTSELALVPVLESIGHMAWDTLRQRRFPFSSGLRTWDSRDFAAAIEAQDEAGAVACLRGALAQGMEMRQLQRDFIAAALAHYQGFGHALIYTYKASQLVDALGPAVMEPVALSLIRYLCNSTREDLIPEFRPYTTALAGWKPAGTRLPAVQSLAGLSISKALEAVGAAAGAPPQALFTVLFHSACLQMLNFDYALDERCHQAVSKNANWLDFTHALTFANALRWATGHCPEKWPAGLLQMACFIGRNSSFQNPVTSADPLPSEDLETWIDQALQAHLDHQYPEYIVSCHYLKLLVAVREELRHHRAAPWRGTLAAALHRMLALPIKRKHVLRVAYQAVNFISKED